MYESYGNRLIVNGELKTQRFSVTNAVDNHESTDPFYCFASLLESGGSAAFDIPWSLITHISVLNSDDSSKIFEFQVSILFFISFLTATTR